MMKKLLKSFAIFALGLFAVTGPATSLYAASAQSTDNIGEIVDVTTDVGGDVKDCAESISQFLADTNDEQALDILVNALKKAGLKGGWAKQIGQLKQFAKYAGRLLDAIKIGDTVRQLSNVWDDRAAFSSVFADQMTEYASDTVGALVSEAVKYGGTALIAGSTIVAPGVGTIVATGGVWLVSWIAGEVAERVFELVCGTEVIRSGMESIGGFIWDLFHNPGDSDDDSDKVCKPGDDPFDDDPDNGGDSKSGRANSYQGLKALRLIQ